MEQNINFIKQCMKVYGGQTTLENILLLLNEADYIDIYTDGSTQFDGINRRSAVGVYFSDNDDRNLAQIVETKDNNECEIMACMEALKIVLNKYHFINIFTDSRLVVDRMNNICRSNKCKKLFDELELLNKQFIDVNYFGFTQNSPHYFDIYRNNVKYTYVKGHSDNDGNNKADALSRSLL